VTYDSKQREDPISAIAVARGHPEVIWVGHSDGQLFRTEEGLAGKPTWFPDRVPEVDRRWCTRIVIDPADPGHVFALFGGYHDDNLWEKKNGRPWECRKIDLDADSSGPLRAPIRSLAIHPDRPDFYYLGTDIGLLASGDAGRTWVPIQEGPILCPVDELFWMDRTLGIATHARGFYSLDLKDAGRPR
jgi:hypothetical protein